MSETENIVVIGSTNTDMVILTDHFPAPGETIIGGEFFMNPGGKGANQAVAAARSGGRVAFVGKVGNDSFGRQAVRNLKDESIDVSCVATDEENHSGTALITVDKKGENSIVVAAGANMAMIQDDIDRAAPQIRQAHIVLLQMEIPLNSVWYAAQKAHDSGKKVMLNPAPATTLPDELFPLLHVITPNETETKRLTGIHVEDEKSAARGAEWLKNKGVEIVIITMGAAGAYVYGDGLSELIPAPNVQAVDTTAAGDSFNGALAAGLARGTELGEAVRYANRVASIAVTRRGAQASIPFREEVVDG